MFKNNFIKAFLLRFITKSKQTNFDIKQAQSVLFMRYDRIGDMVISSPVFRELKLQYPQIKITVLASKINQGVLVDNPYVDKVVINHKNNFIYDLPSLLALRKEKFDVCIEFDHSIVPHAIIRLRLINPKKIISIKKYGRYGVSGNELELYDYFIEKNNKEHFRDIWLALLKPFEIQPRSNKYDLFINEKSKNQAQNFLKKYSSHFLVGINLEGAVKGKKIQISELYQICQGLFSKFNDIKIIILSTPINFQKTSQLVKKMNLNYVKMSFKTNEILDVAALIKHLDLIVTPDTAIVHIASAYNKPTVSIHENNQASYKLFAPTSKLKKTVFSKSKNSLKGFSVDLLLEECFVLIESIKKAN